MSLEAIRFNRTEKDNVKVEVLDQLLLPYITEYLPINNITDGFEVILSMQVRGAPAIAIVGSLSILVEIQSLLQKKEKIINTNYGEDITNWSVIKIELFNRLKYLLGSRPTAVNLANALNEIVLISNKVNSLNELNLKLYEFVCQLIDEDLLNNIKMGDNGAKFLLEELNKEKFEGDFAVLTICNTGALATSGYGTALGVIRSLWKDSQSKDGKISSDNIIFNSKAQLKHVYPLETRPYNQGSRLTAYELVHEKIPATLITDSMISYRIKTSPIPIKAAFVGADRIVRNGDTANKIGTYQLSIICKEFGIKFFVVAPKTTVDNNTNTGDEIIIEERKPNEMKLVTGTQMDTIKETILLDKTTNKIITSKVGIAPLDINVWNPGFDVTPYENITGIVTEDGVFTKDETTGKFQLEALF